MVLMLQSCLKLGALVLTVLVLSASHQGIGSVVGVPCAPK